MITTGQQRTTDGNWRHTGRLVVSDTLELQPRGAPPGAATLILPDGTITTAMLAQGAAEARVGAYAQAINWSLGQASTWTETPLQVTVALSGALVRIEFNVLLACPTKGQRIFYAIMLDGVQPAPNTALGALDAPEANFAMMACGTYYLTPAAAGTHRIALGVAGPAGCQIYNVIASTLYVSEMRR